MASFTALYDAEAPKLLAYFNRRVHDPELAFDLTSETFAQALSSRRSFRGSGRTDQVRWLYGVAKHQLSRYFRRGVAETQAIDRLGIDRPHLDVADLERIEELAGSLELRAAIREALRDLPDPQRVALQLRVVDELSYQEVADRLGVSEQTARQRVSRGLRALADVLDTIEIGVAR